MSRPKQEPERTTSAVPVTPHDAASQDAAIPLRIGRFKVTREVGRGSMGVVLEALDERLGRRVALKILPSSVSDHPLALQQVEREARALAAINHPNVATLHGLEDEGGTRVLVMELVEGPSLRDRLADGPLPLREALLICARVAAGLSATHDRGIIHRDLKPSNIRVGAGGLVKVLDFGIAVAGDDASSSSASEGTPGYMSPEQINGSPADARSDAWGFGCVLFELLAGCQAFHGTTRHECEAATRAASPPWDALPAATPQRVLELLHRCLAADASQRLGSLREAQVELERALAWEEGAQEDGLGASPLSLPVHSTSFVGREQESRDVAALLEESRLVTILGIGGAGKTRLAVHVAEAIGASYKDGAHFIDLVAVRTHEGLVPAFATALGIRETPGTNLEESLLATLNPLATLLVVDNCEQIAESCGILLDRMLARSASVRLLATSRDRLGAPGEREYRIPLLALPAETGTRNDLDASPAGRLFVERALAASPNTHIDDEAALHACRIVHRLEGLPLAIELAAARLRNFGLADLSHRLDSAFTTLEVEHADAPVHQRTLSAMLDWSHELLPLAEACAYRRLAVFAGTCSLDAAEAVASGPEVPGSRVAALLARLVESSLLMAEERGGRRRYRLLEIVREHAARQLERAGETETVERAHLAFFRAMAVSTFEDLARSDAEPALRCLDAERDNLRAALQFASSLEGAGHEGLVLVARLDRWWYMRGTWSEGRTWLQRMLAAPGSEIRDEHRALALHWCGALCWRLGDIERGHAELEEGLAIFTELGHEAGRAQCLNNLGNILCSLARLDEAGTRYEQALSAFERSANVRGMGAVLGNLGALALHRENYEAAHSWTERSLAIVRENGNRSAECIALNNLGWAELQLGRAEPSVAHFGESLVIARELGDVSSIARALNNTGFALLELGQLREARALLEEALLHHENMGDRESRAQTAWNLSEIDRLEGEPARARARLLEALTLFEQVANRRMLGAVLASLAKLSAEDRDFEGAALLAGASSGLISRHGADDTQRTERLLREAMDSCREALGDTVLETRLLRGKELGTQSAWQLGAETAHQDEPR